MTFQSTTSVKQNQSERKNRRNGAGSRKITKNGQAKSTKTNIQYVNTRPWQTIAIKITQGDPYELKKYFNFVANKAKGFAIKSRIIFFLISSRKTPHIKILLTAPVILKSYLTFQAKLKIRMQIKLGASSSFFLLTLISVESIPRRDAFCRKKKNIKK